jgi:Cu2+-exporting ATPase
VTAAVACPACGTGGLADAAVPAGGATGPERVIDLSIPAAHCAACISTVEAGLARVPGVRGARVNLSRRMVSVRVAEGEGAEDRLIGALAGLGYEAWPLDSSRLGNTADARADRELVTRLGVAGFAMMNVMLLSVAVWSGAADTSRDLFHWVSALIALPAVAYAGQPFFRAAWASLRARRLGMDVPISLALILACGSSLVETMLGGEHAYFDAAVSLAFFLLAGRYLDFRTRAAARSAAAHLAALEVERATRLAPDGTLAVVDVAALVRGDRVVVATGMRVPVDGTVDAGAGEVDASLLTGETLPKPVGVGDTVHAGMVNAGPALTVTVQEQGEGMLVRRIARLVEAATQGKGRYVTLADRAAKLYSPVVHIVAFSAFLMWMSATGDLRVSLNIAIATLIITCPCALGLAVPAVLTAASGRLFRMGLLLKDGAALERLAGVDTAVFDKTGTLTAGRPMLLGEVPRGTLALAAGLAMHSAHPLSRAVVAAAAARGIPATAVADVTEFPGQGIEGRAQGRRVRLGRAAFVGAGGAAGQGMTSWLDSGAGVPEPLQFADAPRAGAAQAVGALRRLGLRSVLLSGDAAGPVAAVAQAAGLDAAEAAMSPQGKAAWLDQARADGRRTLMVGDGLNDAAAVASADVSVAIASGVDATRAAADMILTGGDLGAIPRAVDVARQARRRIIENFAIAFAYNILAVPLAVAGHVTPLAAAVAMSTSSILVSLNALRLVRRGKEPA